MASGAHTAVGRHHLPDEFAALDSAETRTPETDISSSDHEGSPSRSSKSRAQVKKQRKDQHETKPSVPSLRPAKDILSRIRHDPALKESEYVIGYLDRHLPDPVEIDVSEWKGGRDIEEEDWIPQHRILYFRKKGEADGRKVWDRETRLDRLFGSGIPETTDSSPKKEGGKDKT